MKIALDHETPKPAGTAGGLLATIEEVAQTFALDSLQESIETSRRLLARPDAVAVAVLGSFKAGKSSLINTLAGAPLLPVAAVPATAIVTRVSAGPALRATVALASGERRDIPVGDLAAWVTEELNPQNAKGVAEVEVEAPALARFPGVVFIDTPGLGSIFAHNSDTSLAFLPRVEAAVLAIPSTAPLSEADTALLRRIAVLTPRFAVLLTKADLCSEEQRAEVRRFVERQVRLARIEGTVFFWSQHPSFAAMREEFVREFLARLSGHAAEASQEIAEHRIRLLAIEARGLLAAAAAAAQRDSAAKDELRLRLDALCSGPIGVPALLSRLEREGCDLALPHALTVLEPEIATLSAALRTSLKEQSRHWHGTLATTAADYERWIRSELRPRLLAISNAHRSKLAQPLANFAVNCEKLVGEFHARLTDTVREVLGVTLSPPPWRAVLPLPKQPDIGISAAFMFRLDWLWAVIPVALVRSWLCRHLRSRAGWEAEKNLSRVAAQWEGELRKRIRELALSARQHIEVQQQTLGRLLDQGQDALGPIERAAARLEAERIAFECRAPGSPAAARGEQAPESD
jgi:GTP-binding protein EngB required for normal cell division